MEHVTVSVAWLESGPRLTLSGLPDKALSPEEWGKVVALVADMLPGVEVASLPGPLVGTKEAVYVGSPIQPRAFSFQLVE